MDKELWSRFPIPSKVSPAPDPATLELAFELIRAWHHRVYELLYPQKLMSANGGPWTHQPTVDYYPRMTLKRASVNVTVSGETAEEIYVKVMAIEEGLKQGRKPVSSRACCILAEKRPCVCIESLACPVHGISCYGSHD